MNKNSVFYIIYIILFTFGISIICPGEELLDNSNLSFSYLSNDGGTVPISGFICLYPGSTIKIAVQVPEGPLVTYDSARESMGTRMWDGSVNQANTYRWRVVLSNGHTFFPGNINQCQSHPLLLHRGIFYVSMPFLGLIQFDVVKPDMSVANSIFFSSIGGCQVIDIDSYSSYQSAFASIRIKDGLNKCRYLPYNLAAKSDTSLVSPAFEKCDNQSPVYKCPASATNCIFNSFLSLWQVIGCGGIN